jgi:hypothetical protein
MRKHGALGTMLPSKDEGDCSCDTFDYGFLEMTQMRTIVQSSRWRLDPELLRGIHPLCYRSFVPSEVVFRIAH